MAFHEHFEIDSKTGFLTPKAKTRIKNGFTATQKTEWLQIFRKSANFGHACQVIGVGRSTVQDHLKGDLKFEQARKAVLDDICDDMEECLVTLAKHNPTAAFGVLKAYRGWIWKDNWKDPTTKEERLQGLYNTMKVKKEDENG